MAKLYAVTVFDAQGRAMICFHATLEKARLRSHIHRLQGLRPTRPAYAPRMTRYVAAAKARNQIVLCTLQD